jgi:hypothetical protein
LNLESIAVSGQKLPIDSSLFATSNTQGTIVDSGTTLVYLVDGAYDPFVNAVNPILHSSFLLAEQQICDQFALLQCMLISSIDLYLQIAAAVSPSVRSVVNKGSQCFVTSSRFYLLLCSF